MNHWLGVLTGAGAVFAEMSVVAAVVHGDEKPEEQGSLELEAGAESRTPHHHPLPLEISESPLLTWKCLPLI